MLEKSPNHLTAFENWLDGYMWQGFPEKQNYIYTIHIVQVNMRLWGLASSKSTE